MYFNAYAWVLQFRRYLSLEKKVGAEVFYMAKNAILENTSNFKTTSFIVSKHL
jgi:hypothetical protein